jgi:hypothetical protein
MTITIGSGDSHPRTWGEITRHFPGDQYMPPLGVYVPPACASICGYP